EHRGGEESGQEDGRGLEGGDGAGRIDDQGAVDRSGVLAGERDILDRRGDGAAVERDAGGGDRLAEGDGEAVRPWRQAADDQAAGADSRRRAGDQGRRGEAVQIGDGDGLAAAGLERDVEGVYAVIAGNEGVVRRQDGRRVRAGEMHLAGVPRE